MPKTIPLNKPFLSGKEIAYVTEVIGSGDLSSDGRFSAACSRVLEELYAIKRVLLTPSCTAALELAFILCDLKPGDEVILPSFTFTSTANAILRMGAHPVFVDIRPDTLNIDEDLIEDAITSRTRAILPVHYAGVGCEMDHLIEIATGYNLYLVEDAAQGVNAFYGGRALGSLGTLGAYSFHYTKNYGCGEGGALCVNSEEFLDRAEIARDKGTNRGQFLRGEVERYTWIDIGSSFVPSELVCAFLYAQLETMGWVTKRRQKISRFYDAHLRPLAEQGLLLIPEVPEHCQSNYHIYYILLPSATIRNDLMRHLNARDIGAASHYVPLHSSPMGRRLGYRAGHLPVTESVSECLLRLPLYPDLSESDQTRIIDEVAAFLGQVDRSNWIESAGTVKPKLWSRQC
jgi:dTDP-4-amino-4,6-dideoxygalactose transaminase